MNAAIAQHLNVAESAIVRVEEWSNVLFAVVKGIGARFVSKKVVKVKVEQKEILPNVAKAIEQAKDKESNPRRHAVLVDSLKRLAESGRDQLKGDTYGKRQQIKNSIEAIENYLAQF